MKKGALLLLATCCLGLEFLSAAPTKQGTDPDPMSGIPSREELRKRRARATNAPISFAINPVTQKLEARDAEGAILEEYPTGTVGRVLDGGGYELRVSFGRDEKRRLSLMIRPGPAQVQPVQVSVFQRRLILPPGTSVSASMNHQDGVVLIEPGLTGTIYYLDTQPTTLDVPPDQVSLVASKNLVRIGRDVQQGKLPDEAMVDAVVLGTLETEEKQTPQNNAGVAVGAWLQNATVSLMGLPNPEKAPPATVVKVSSATPELSAPAPQTLTPNFDPSLVPSGKNQPPAKMTQTVKVIAVRPDPSSGILPRQPFQYEEGDAGDLRRASQMGLKSRPLQDPSLAPPPPPEILSQKPPGDVAGNSVVKAIRSFLGMPEASTVNQEAENLAGKKSSKP